MQFKWYLGQPWVGLSFRNQLLSCRSCRALRGNFPSNYEALEVLSVDDPAMFQQVVASMQSGARALPPDQAQALYTAASRSMLWPDTSLNADGELLFQGTTNAGTFGFESSTSSQVQLAQRNLVRLSPADAMQDWANTPVDGVWIVPSQTIGDLKELDRAYATVLMGSLNSFHPRRSPPDARVYARTQALKAILASWNYLDWILGGALRWYRNVTSPLALLMMAPSVIDAAQSVRAQVRSTGFWSLWFSVFGQKMRTVDPWSRLTDREREILMFSLFIQYEPPTPTKESYRPLELSNVLPGTDLDRIPTFVQETRR